MTRPSSLRSTCFGLALLGVLAAAGTLSAAPLISVGERLPTTSLQDGYGKAHNLGGRRGTVQLLFFFGYSPSTEACVVPGAEIETKLNQRYSNRGLSVFGIDCWNSDDATLDEFQRRTAANYPILENGMAFSRVCELPYLSFVVVDTDGVVQYVSSGPDPRAYDVNALEQVVQLYLERASSVEAQTWGRIKDLYGR